VGVDRQLLEFKPDAVMGLLPAGDERVHLLVQLPRVGLLHAITILAEIGPIDRFPTARSLVGYGGLGALVHERARSTETAASPKPGGWTCVLRCTRSPSMPLAATATG